MWFTGPPPSWMIPGERVVCLIVDWNTLGEIPLDWWPRFMQTYTIRDLNQHDWLKIWGIGLTEDPMGRGWWTVYSQKTGQINWAPVVKVEDTATTTTKAPTTTRKVTERV